MKGFLFTPKMAVAAMREDGPKTVTRRVMSPQPSETHETADRTSYRMEPELKEHVGTTFADFVYTMGEREAIPCDYRVGERRCLLTTWAVCAALDGHKPTEIWTDEGDVTEMREGFWHAGLGTPKPDWCGKSRPGRFLPNHLRPLMPLLKVVSVRVERVQDITAKEIIAEGAVNRPHELEYFGKCPVSQFDGKVYTDLMSLWASGWNAINEKRGFGWAVNPWCWRVEFRRITP